ncbi:HAD-IA family hydrolase [Breoghania sp.]|uniref:HAD-IIA family hydrolase n=1 Tax=Breoghania sp. TaxID=2065378 RepID=UPI002AA6F346|nr:HAD-IA family hydrolase [Breoghania sp.]
MPGARGFLERYGHKLALVSNNSTHEVAGLHEKLRLLGLHIPVEQIHLAGELALAKVASLYPGRRVFLLGSAAMERVAFRHEIELSETNADVVVVCRDTRLSLVRLEGALAHIERGCPVIVANNDLTHPRVNGSAVETGAIFALLAACHEPDEVVYVGKPEPCLFEEALKGTPAEEAVMVGDNPLTDIAGAARLGMPAVLLGSESRFRLEDL